MTRPPASARAEFRQRFDGRGGGARLRALLGRGRHHVVHALRDAAAFLPRLAHRHVYLLQQGRELGAAVLSGGARLLDFVKTLYLGALEQARHDRHQYGKAEHGGQLQTRGLVRRQ